MKRALRYALCVLALTGAAGCQLVVDFPRSLIARDASPQTTDGGHDAKCDDWVDPDAGDDGGTDDGGLDASADAAQP